MEQLDAVRLDKWLFAVRIFKSRSLAAQAIGGGKIKINGHGVKAHRLVKVGEEIWYRRDGRTYKYEVCGLIEKRVGAKDAVAHYKVTEDADVTPEVREMLELYRTIDKGSQPRGKPSKRDRRMIQKLKELD